MVKKKTTKIKKQDQNIPKKPKAQMLKAELRIISQKKRNLSYMEANSDIKL